MTTHKKYLFIKLTTALLLALMLTNTSLVMAADGADNWAVIELRHLADYSTEDDHISNTPHPFNSWWGVYFLNWPDETHEPISNPNVTLITDSTFSSINANLPWGYFGPLAPNFTAQPVYMWYWNKNLNEGTIPQQAIDIQAREAEGTRTFAPGFSVTRQVSSAKIRTSSVVQITEVSLKIEEPLPNYINSVSVSISAWWSSEVYTEFLRAIPTPSVVFGTQAIQWHIPTTELQIGKTYRFRAVFRIYKQVEQEVLYKPEAGVGVSYRTQLPQTDPTNQVTINHPDDATAILSAENQVKWSITITGGHGLKLSRISEILQS